jgi:hypothetical protein
MVSTRDARCRVVTATGHRKKVPADVEIQVADPTRR